MIRRRPTSPGPTRGLVCRRRGASDHRFTLLVVLIVVVFAAAGVRWVDAIRLSRPSPTAVASTDGGPTSGPIGPGEQVVAIRVDRSAREVERAGSDDDAVARPVGQGGPQRTGPVDEMHDRPTLTPPLIPPTPASQGAAGDPVDGVAVSETRGVLFPGVGDDPPAPVSVLADDERAWQELLAMPPETSTEMAVFLIDRFVERFPGSKHAPGARVALEGALRRLWEQRILDLERRRTTTPATLAQLRSRLNATSDPDTRAQLARQIARLEQEQPTFDRELARLLGQAPPAPGNLTMLRDAMGRTTPETFRQFADRTLRTLRHTGGVAR